MANKTIDKKTIKEVATAIYADVKTVISNYTTRDGEDTVPYFKPDALEGFCDEIDAIFEEGYGVEVTPRNPLSSYTWAQIAEISGRGDAANTFKIGDTKQFMLLSGEHLTAVIIGFDHDYLSENDAATNKTVGITFGIKEIMDGWYEMNADDTNKDGWNGCKMRNTYMARIFNLLPPELKDIIKTVAKPTGRGANSARLDVANDKLFLFSEVELTGATEYTTTGEGWQYEYFKDEENRIKERSDGSACVWWLRSPYVDGVSTFRCVSSFGVVHHGNAGYACGVSFGFCV